MPFLIPEPILDCLDKDLLGHKIQVKICFNCIFIYYKKFISFRKPRGLSLFARNPWWIAPG